MTVHQGATQRDYVGHLSQTSYGVETTWGTKPTSTSTSFGKVLTCKLQEKSGLFEHRSKSSGRNVGSQVPGRIRVEGSIEVNPQHSKFLQYVFGSLYKGSVEDGTQATDDTQIVSACDVTADGTALNNLTIAVSGSYKIGGTSYTTSALSSITIGAAHATLPRVDIVSIHDNTGTTVATVTAGTAATNPVPAYASVPADDLIVAIVYVAAGVTIIKNSDIRNIFWVKESNNLSSFTVEDDYIDPSGSSADDIIKYFKGCKVNEFSFGVAREQTEPIKYTYNLIGKQRSIYNEDISSTITDSTAAFFHEWDTTIKIDASTDYDLNDFSFAVNNGLKLKGTDGRYAGSLLTTQRTYTSSAKIDLKDMAEMWKFHGQASASGTESSGSAIDALETLDTFVVEHTLNKPNYEFTKFIFSNCAYKMVEEDDRMDDTIEQSLDISIRSCIVQILDSTEAY